MDAPARKATAPTPSPRDSSNPPVPVLVLGANGLIGSAAMRALVRLPDYSVTAASRRAVIDSPASVASVRCDIRDPEATYELVRRNRIIVHCASYIGSDPELLQNVNIDGTRNIVDAARATPGTIVLYVSTAGVYGTVTESGGTETDYRTAPESPLSQSRAAAEHIVLEHGGSVVRPLFVTGAGDHHFLLPLAAAILAIGAWIDEGKARLSVISATELGRVLSDLCGPLLEGRCPPVLHVTAPTPVTVGALVSPILERLGVHLTQSISATEAMNIAQTLGLPPRKLQQFQNDYFINATAAAAHSRHLISASGIPTDDDVTWYCSELAKLRSARSSA